MQAIIVTGLSGSGKSKAVNVLEDSGYYCLDNLPVRLLPKFIDMILQLEDFPQKVCFTIDMRDNSMTDTAVPILEQIRGKLSLRILFLDCDDSVLLKRYKESRRLHPLMMYDEDLDLPGAIAAERHALENIRQQADMVIDTSLTTTGELKEKIEAMLPAGEQKELSVSFVAFGYKYGIPSDCDLVFDVRCLPNPFYVPELKDKTGEDREVREYVMSSPESVELLDRIISYLDCTLPLYKHEGKYQLVVGIGCTGGQHRSLTFAILLAEYYLQQGYVTHASARDRRKIERKETEDSTPKGAENGHPATVSESTDRMVH